MPTIEELKKEVEGLAPGVRAFEPTATTTPEEAEREKALALSQLAKLTPPPASTPASGAPTTPAPTGYHWTQDNAGNWVLGADATDLTSEILPEGAVTKENADYQTLVDMENSVGVLTAEEEASIKEQAKASGLPYDALIAQAQEEKRQGMATGTVRAGQRGGFESTQFAGQAAIPKQITDEARKKIEELRALGVQIDYQDTRSQGTWIGQGGALEKIQSAYDLNINNLQIKKQQAIAEAEASLRTAKLTGKEADFNRATKLFELAQKANEDAINMQYKKIQTLQATQDYFKSQVDFKQEQEDKLVATTAQALSSVLTGDDAADMKLIQQEAAAKGVDPNKLVNAINDYLKESMFFKSGDFASFMKELPAGESRDIVDPFTGTVYTIQGFGSTAPDIYLASSSNDAGDVLTIARNKTTGEELWRKTEKGVGKTKTQASSVTINAAGARTPVYNKGKQIGYQAYNDKTGKIQNFDMNGNPTGNWPEGATLGTFGAGNPTEIEQLEQQAEVLIKG